MRRQSTTEEMFTLRRQFLVESIMVSTSRLSRAGTVDEAVPKFVEYDNVPCPKTGSIRGYFFKVDLKQHPIQKVDLIGGGTSLLDLLSLFEFRTFYFVLHANEIAGYIHYSDLNHNYVRIPLFGLLQIVEQRLWARIENLVTPSAIRARIPKPFAKIQKQKERNDSHNMGLGWAGTLYFPEILTLAAHFKKADLSDDKIRMFRHVRNAVAHAHGTLVRRKKDIIEIAEVYRMSMLIIASA